MWRTGLSNDSPNMFSITIWCESPMPSDEAAAARGLHGERLLRHRERVAAVRRHDAGRELDARHLAADDREHAHRVEGEDLGERVRREAVGLGGLGVGDDVVDRAAGGVAAEDPDAHGALPSIAAEATPYTGGPRGRGSAGRAQPCQG